MTQLGESDRLIQLAVEAETGLDGFASLNSLFKAELVRNRGPWKSIDDLEIAVTEYIDWFTSAAFHGEIGPSRVEYETLHRRTALPEQPAQRQFPVSIEPGT